MHDYLLHELSRFRDEELRRRAERGHVDRAPRSRRRGRRLRIR